MAAVARAWLSIAPQQTQAREALARALLESGDLDGAAEAFQPIIAANPTPSAAHALTYGRICLNAQRFEEAETYLSAALKQTPNAPDALVAKARLATFHGDTDGSQRAVRTGHRSRPEPSTRLSAIGDCHARATGRTSQTRDRAPVAWRWAGTADASSHGLRARRRRVSRTRR